MKFFFAIIATIIAFPVSGQKHLQDPTCKGIVRGTVLGQDGRPVKGIGVVLDPLGVDLGVILPHTKTDQQGKYHFEQVCVGRFSVLVQDDEAGYPLSSSYWYQFLCGHQAPEVKITDAISGLSLTFLQSQHNSKFT
jgi:hypothetical protein